MSLTTSDELQKQLTVIFGYTGFQQIEAGEIRGIGKLSRHHSIGLIKNILEFLSGFNGMLQEFAGCELFSIEFELLTNQQQAKTRLLPKSMLFIPGFYKETVSLLLLLAPQLSLLDNQKPKKSINQISQLLHEIEEAVDIPELNLEKRRYIIQKFSSRFTSKIQAEAIEANWNRKMVGLKEEEKITPYLNMNLEFIRNWKEKKVEILNPRFGYPRLRLSENQKDEFSKYSINSSIAYIIAQQSFLLGHDLLSAANTGTTDDTQKQILTLILNIFLKNIEKPDKMVDLDLFIHLWDKYLKKIEEWKDIFRDRYQKYISLIVNKSFDEIESDYNRRNKFLETNLPIDLFINKMGKIVIQNIKDNRYDIKSYQKLRLGDFQAPFLVILENLNIVINKIKKTYKEYIQIYYFDEMVNRLMEELEKNLLSIKNESTIYIGKKILVYLKNYLHIQFGLKFRLISVRSQAHLLLEFKRLLKDMIEPFIQTFSINIKDLLDYCEFCFKSNPEYKLYITKLHSFQEEIEFIWGFILRNSTLQRFLKKFPNDKDFTPQNFGEEFIQFLTKHRTIIYNLQWREVFFTYIRDFVIRYQNEYEISLGNGEKWPKNKILSMFMEYISNRVKKDTSIDGFIEPMKNYIDKIALSNVQYKNLVEIYHKYIEGLEIVNEFPDFLRQIFYISIESFIKFSYSYPIKKIIGPLRSTEEILTYDLQDMKEDFRKEKSFYGFIVEEEMKYFSSLLAFPKTLLLKSSEPIASSNLKIDHIIDFQILKEKFIKVSISTNFDKISPFLGGEKNV
ncbi:MAG: hypothetical protein ACTSWC_08750 [Promethearchaeota archaeon]